MPQLTPFYFLSQLSVSFLVLLLLVVLLSYYFLPFFQVAQVIRMFITKLSN